MAINLSKVKQGDVFKTQNGEYMGYWFSESFSKYKHKLYNLKNESETYWYSNEGECGDDSKKGEFNLVEKVEKIESLSEEEKLLIENAKKEAIAAQKTTSPQSTQSSNSIEGWAIVLKVFGWFTLLGCIVAFFVLLEDRYLDDMAWLPLVIGIILIVIKQVEFILRGRSRGFHLITEEVKRQLPPLPKVGLLNLFIQHTSAALSINENADPDVRVDMESIFNHLVKEREPYYEHVFEGDDDMPAHAKSSIIGASLSIPITDGRLNLGTWQGIYLCEFRNYGGSRRVVATIIGE